eukprot:TRINITY_DN43281_c0_g1_i1.p2 TRINITY_DN43281_c0_g1~~TRINITY_DN43281_c0_g1_i1.p2  ORF type:complete len:349 (+),score=82.30 TRINITY_DN43281_c0_g1_i1:66-1049(+)
MSSPVVVGRSRLGIDVGGVLNQHLNDTGGTVDWHTCTSSAAPGMLQAVRFLVSVFRPENVFVVSKLTVGGPQQRRTEHWLTETMDFFNETGMCPANVHFCNCISGPEGKGVVAQKLGLSHFIDDKHEVLESVIGDRAGNSGDCVAAHRGGPTLFHFARSGIGDQPPRRPRLSSALDKYYVGVANWADVLTYFDPDRQPVPSAPPAPPALPDRSCRCGRPVNSGFDSCCSQCARGGGHSERCQARTAGPAAPAAPPHACRCGRPVNPGFESCCSQCARGAGHSERCRAGSGAACAKGCGRPCNPGHDTCCSGCARGGAHSTRCDGSLR